MTELVSTKKNSFIKQFVYWFKSSLHISLVKKSRRPPKTPKRKMSLKV